MSLATGAPPEQSSLTPAEQMLAEPLPALLLRRGAVPISLLGALNEERRLELFVTDELSPEWASFAQRLPAVFVAGTDDPLSALVYVRTAGVHGPLVVALTRKWALERQRLMDAGAAACLMMPIVARDLDEVVGQLAREVGQARLDGTLRLLLDPIARVARYKDKQVRMTQREFALLHCLGARGARPMPSDELLASVWGDKPKALKSRRLLDVYIFQLRKKLARIGLAGAIVTVRGYGYSLHSPTAERSR